MGKSIIDTDGAPKAIGPYSQAVMVGEVLFMSGQIAIDPGTGKIEASNVAAQTRQAIRNLEAVLAAAGLTLRHIVKTTIYLASMDDFKAVNEAYAEFFPSEPPARATLEVSRLPLDALVEIEAIARR